MTQDFKRIFDGLRVALAVTDPQGGLAFGNASFVELTAQDARALPGLALASLFAPEDRKRVQQNLARVAEGKAASALFDAQLSAHGVIRRWVSVALQPALDARDRPGGVIAVLRDIGAQRETEDALNLVTARLLAFAEASPVAAMVETLPGDIELANQAFCELLQLDSAPQSLTGLAVHEVLGRSPLVPARALQQIRAAPERAASLSLETADGRCVTLERRPIVVEEEAAGAVWIGREGARPPQARPARGAGEVALIEKIGQEISVALEGLASLSMRAQQMEMDDAVAALLQRIRGSTEAAMGALGDLVDFSRLSGGVVLEKAPFGLRSALAELVARAVPAAEERGCRLRLKVEQDVADALEGDAARLQLVLKNLLDNAFMLAPGGEVLLQITTEYVTETGIQLSFSGAASGAPADAAPAKASPDSGMGVAVAKFMVGAMGGKLAIATKPGAEALYAFTIEFPVRAAEPAKRRAAFATLVGMPVMLVASDREQRGKLAGLLRGWRMLPLEADNAPMAIALLERMHEEGTPVPLVMLANRLPVQDGFLLAFRIRHHPRLAATLVMMLATDGRPGDAIACRENGISAYMRYPIAEHQLNEAISAVTGASVDADEAPTLVTRHSLREQRKGATILLVDPSRDSQILAAHVLGRHDCSIVVAHDFAEAAAALDQDLYDAVLVETSLPGLDGPDAAAALRQRIAREPEATRLIAVSLEHSPRFRAEKLAQGFDASLGKPFRVDDLVALLQSLGRPRTRA